MSPLTKTLARWGAGLKAAIGLVFQRSQWGGYSLARGTRVDYTSLVGDGRGNTIVLAVLGWIQRNFPAAPLEVVATDAEGQETVIETHALTALLERPNDFYSGALLWQATLADLALGNAYWWKRRSGAGRPAELWWIPASLIEPKWPESDTTVFISHYEYTPNGTPIRLERQDVVHFREGLDSVNQRKGCSKLAWALREIYTDEEAANYTSALLRNMGVPGVIISPGKDVEITAEQAEGYKTAFMQRFTGDQRGMPMVTGRQVEATTLSFTPEQMNLRDLRRIPEERVSAIFGIPAIVAGLGAGLDRSTFANMSEAREAAYEENIIPLQRLLAAELTTQLLSDFGDTTRVRLRFDLSQVRVLQDDQNQLMTRAAEGFQKGILTRGEARSMVGQAAEDTDDVFALPVQMGLIARDQDAADLTPALPAPADPLALPPGKGRKADPPAERITDADIAHAREWVAGLGLPELEAAVNGKGTNGKAH